jgi:hypothetical protein
MQPRREQLTSGGLGLDRARKTDSYSWEPLASDTLTVNTRKLSALIIHVVPLASELRRSGFVERGIEVAPGTLHSLNQAKLRD